MSGWNYVNPPVWEAGIAAVTEIATALDDYDVAAVHRLFDRQFPRAERQLPIGPMSPFIVEAEQQLAPMVQFQQIQAAATARWWFTSDDGSNLLQIQDQFLGRNWRKLSPGLASAQNYPQFEGLLTDFNSMIDRLSKNARERDREFPNPSLCDILYVNMIPLTSDDGERLKLRDVLAMIQFREEVLKSGMQFQWFERFGADGASLALHVLIHIIAIPGITAEGSEALMPMVRLSLNARAPCRAWQEHSELATISHDYMRDRLLALTTPAAQARWDVS